MLKLARFRLRLRSCPRCKGDLALELDQWGLYEQCIQCGYLHDLKDVDKVKRRQIQEVRAKKLSKLR